MVPPLQKNGKQGNVRLTFHLLSSSSSFGGSIETAGCVRRYSCVIMMSFRLSTHVSMTKLEATECANTIISMRANQAHFQIQAPARSSASRICCIVLTVLRKRSRVFR